MSIQSRIGKAERKLSVGSEPRVIGIVMFGGKDQILPPEHQQGNNIIRHVHYEDICNEADQIDSRSIEDED